MKHKIIHLHRATQRGSDGHCHSRTDAMKYLRDKTSCKKGRIQWGESYPVQRQAQVQSLRQDGGKGISEA